MQDFDKYRIEMKNTSIGKDYSVQPHLCALKVVNDLEASENPIYQIAQSISARIVEEQEQIILNTIRRIGDTTYHDITIDKEQVLDMLKKYKSAKVLKTEAYPHRLYCPACYHTLLCNEDNMSFYHEKVSNNCPNCGQKLDWTDYTKGSSQ